MPSIAVSLAVEREYFDQQARELMGVSGDEFLRRWRSGEYKAIADDPDHTEIIYLAAMIPLAE